MESSRLSFKLFVDGPAEMDLKPFVLLFHSWIQNHAITDHLLIDVANYEHVHNGPGIVLVSHEANYSLDRRGGKLGLTYQRKQPIQGDLPTRLKAAFGSTVTAARLLSDKLKFKSDQFEFRICDRLLAPNNPQTFQSIKADLLKVWPGATLLPIHTDSELFTVFIQPTKGISI